MITSEGKQHIRRYLAGQINTIARSISFGVGTTAETMDDKRMEFEIARADIHLSSYDYVADKIIFKATIPANVSGEIREVSLWSQASNTIAGSYASRMITSFDSASERWTGGTFASDNTRIGVDSLSLSAAAGAATFATLNEVYLDLSGYSASDKFGIAYNNVGNVASAEVRLLTDAANYYRLPFTPSAGYNVYSVEKGNAAVVGAPNWSAINSIEIHSVSTAGGTGTINFDGLRIEDVDSINADYLMVTRDVLETPVMKVQSRPMDIEFAIGVVT